MKLLIDTCNILHRTGILPPDLAGIDERGLANLVQNSRYGNLKVDFMCDGPRVAADGRVRATTGPGCRFRFAGRHQTADALIIKALQNSSSPRRLLVVSSDRAIQIEARKRRCRVLSADDFLEQLAQDDHSASRKERFKRPPMDGVPRSAEFWLKEFGLESEEPNTPDPAQRRSSFDSTAEPRPEADSVPPLPETSSPIPEATSSPSTADSPTEEVRWRRLMEEADRLWEQHQESDDSSA
ncbi:MAG: hypothetical protein CBC35_02365 [Planctomycetes bacterium TMED75]|nr:hypothetical protein [Planctomycetaceae bacterium]OUU95842.1 MAG: hypothetical protein CBC35_02365 [Planctomycetes bacterium TMED75]